MSYSFKKHPDEILDYGFNLVDWLTGEEKIATIAFTAEPPGLVTLGDEVNAETAFAVWVAGGAVNDRVKLTCSATTDAAIPRTFVRTIDLAIVER